MPLDRTGVPGKVADGPNDVILANQLLERELARVREVVGEQGRLSERVALGSYSWTSSRSTARSSVGSRPTRRIVRSSRP